MSPVATLDLWGFEMGWFSNTKDNVKQSAKRKRMDEIMGAMPSQQQKKKPKKKKETLKKTMEY
jgi:hypothetical protein